MLQEKFEYFIFVKKNLYRKFDRSGISLISLIVLQLSYYQEPFVQIEEKKIKGKNKDIFYCLLGGLMYCFLKYKNRIHKK
jgi:hypothetical protein